jgi:hypothetical protein
MLRCLRCLPILQSLIGLRLSSMLDRRAQVDERSAQQMALQPET